ncbi:MAG: hypothetical protein KUG68_10825 [Flavobacteriaceae bacterium]|nr:hypothetical protein [Flavobacteriaceae bacterium]
MKIILALFSVLVLSSFTSVEKTTPIPSPVEDVITFASFSLVNDTKEKVSIHTGSGFVSLNKGSKTSITCNTSKEVRWASKGKKGDVIFKITSDMCGKTLKLSKLM